MSIVSIVILLSIAVVLLFVLVCQAGAIVGRAGEIREETVRISNLTSMIEINTEKSLDCQRNANRSLDSYAIFQAMKGHAETSSASEKKEVEDDSPDTVTLSDLASSATNMNIAGLREMAQSDLPYPVCAIFYKEIERREAIARSVEEISSEQKKEKERGRMMSDWVSGVGSVRKATKATKASKSHKKGGRSDG